MRALIAALLLCPATAIADPAFYTADRMHELCKEAPDLVDLYAAGVLDGAIGVEIWKAGRPSICVREGSTIEHAGEVMCSYIERNPGERHKTAAAIAWSAFYAAWPCPY